MSSALQRAEIAEILYGLMLRAAYDIGFSALQRAEIAEMLWRPAPVRDAPSFSALQRAEIAEIELRDVVVELVVRVSVLFNEPKLLKFCRS